MANKKCTIITNGSGTIVAAAFEGQINSQGQNVKLRPLKDQVSHTIEVPEQLLKIKSAHEFHMALKHVFAQKMANKEIRIVKKEH